MGAFPFPVDRQDQPRRPRGVSLVRFLGRRFAQHEVRRGSEFAASWNADQLRSACRLVAAEPNGDAISRASVTFPCPRTPGAALVVLEYARDLARQHRLETRCVLHHDLVTVTFASPGTGNGMEGQA